MEKVDVIKNLISLVNLTSEEALAIVRELIADYKLNVWECFRQSAKRVNEEHASVQNQDIFDGDSAEKPEEGKENTCRIIVFDPVPNEDSAQSDIAEETATDVAETSPEIVESVQAEPVKRKRGRPKKVKTEETETSVAEPQVKRRGGRPKKVKPEETSVETISAEAPAKRKRGRSKKVKSEDVVTEADTESVSEEVDDEETALKEAMKVDADQLLLEETPKVVSRKNSGINKVFVRLADCPELAKQAMGAEQPFDFLYKWKRLNVLSSYVLSGMMPVGIYVPYKSVMFGKYRGFVVSLYDEKVLTDAAEAFAEAERSFEPVDGEAWSIMNSLQWGVIRNNQDYLSRMFRKVGGDGLRGPYKTVSPHSRTVCGIGTFRYTVDVQ